MSEVRFRRARVIALRRLATTAEEDARNCDDEALDPAKSGEPDLVRRALSDLAQELRRRVKRLEASGG